MTAKPQADPARIAEWLRLLWEPGQVAELRVLGAGYDGTVSGYYDSPDRLARAAAAQSGRAPGVYWTINPVRPELLARATNKAKPKAKQTTSDQEVARRRWLFIDFDPDRPAGISASDVEKAAALAVARGCRDVLTAEGWPAPVLADSGNGAHLLYRIDLPNDDDARRLLQRVLRALAFRFGTAAVKVDQTTFNAARIAKIYGTLSAKGDSTTDRPHRLAALLDAPAEPAVVPAAALEALAATCPAESGSNGKASGGQHAPTIGEGFDLERWLEDHKVPVVSRGPWNDGYRWIINPCPWNEAHTNRSAYVVRGSRGGIAAGCHHDGCAGKGWHDLRDVYEPGWRERRQGRDAAVAAEAAESLPEQTAEWPDPPDAAAYHGLAGDVVRTIGPHSEADVVALLVQFLVAFGNVIHRQAHYRAEGDWHFCNLFAVLVGRTSKGRKGSSWGRIRQLFMVAATEGDKWLAERVQGGLSSGEGVIWAVRDPINKREPVKERGRVVHYQEVEADPGVADKRLLLVEPEYASVLKVLDRQGNTLSTIIRQAWESGDLRTLTKNTPAKATGAHISIAAHVTVEELKRYLSATEQANGFGNRFLWVCVQRSKCLPEGGRLEWEDLTALAGRLREAVAHGKTVGEMARDDQARADWHAVYPALSRDRPGLAGCVLGRAEAQVMRLACVYALLDLSSVVRREHLEAALALWTYCEDSVGYIFGDSLGDPLADEILRSLRASPAGLKRSELRADAVSHHATGQQLDRALALLRQYGLARMVQEKTEGRPAERWFAVSRSGKKGKEGK